MENEHEKNYFLWRRGKLFAGNASQGIVTFAFDLIGFTLSIGLVLMGYTYGKSASDRILSSHQVTEQYVVIEPTPVPVFPTPDLRDCPDGFQFFTTDEFKICLPDKFSREGGFHNEQRFTAGGEEFVIRLGAGEQFPIHMCNFQEEAIVSGSPATRTIFRKETGGGCGEIIGFATDIHDPYGSNAQIHLSRNGGTYTDDNLYLTIERSLQL